MPHPILEGDHYILRKLCNEVLPWTIGGARADRQWFVKLAAIYAYGGETATALTGLGVGAPIVALLQGKVGDGQSAVDILRQTLPGIWFWIGIGALVLWIVGRIIIAREDVLARALFAKDCSRTMQRLHTDLYAAVAEANPMSKITVIQETAIRKVQEAISKNVWPWREGPPPDSEISAELAQRVGEIRTRYMPHWEPAPPGAI